MFSIVFWRHHARGAAVLHVSRGGAAYLKGRQPRQAWPPVCALLLAEVRLRRALDRARHAGDLADLAEDFLDHQDLARTEAGGAAAPGAGARAAELLALAQ